MNNRDDDNSHLLNAGIVETLRTVIDPELRINIIDMGLVYDISINRKQMQINVSMTLSSKFCPVGESIIASAQNALERCFDGFKIVVTLSWEPEWNYKFISGKGLDILRGI